MHALRARRDLAAEKAQARMRGILARRAAKKHRATVRALRRLQALARGELVRIATYRGEPGTRLSKGGGGYIAASFVGGAIASSKSAAPLHLRKWSKRPLSERVGRRRAGSVKIQATARGFMVRARM